MNIFGLGTAEIVVILVVVLLFFGKDKLPELARSIGRSFRELKTGFDTSAPADEKNKAKTDATGSKR